MNDAGLVQGGVEGEIVVKKETVFVPDVEADRGRETNKGLRQRRQVSERVGVRVRLSRTDRYAVLSSRIGWFVVAAPRLNHREAVEVMQPNQHRAVAAGRGTDQRPTA